jgi:hypothetical protein
METGVIGIIGDEVTKLFMTFAFIASVFFRTQWPDFFWQVLDIATPNKELIFSSSKRVRLSSHSLPDFFIDAETTDVDIKNKFLALTRRRDITIILLNTTVFFVFLGRTQYSLPGRNTDQKHDQRIRPNDTDGTIIYIFMFIALSLFKWIYVHFFSA